MADWCVSVAPVPEHLGAPEAWALHGAAEVSSAVELASWGHDDTAYTAQYMLARLREQQYATRVRLVATEGGRGASTAADVLGTANLIMPVAGDARTAHLELIVHPAWRRRGVGTALLAEAERTAAAHGRSTVIADSEHVGEPPEGDPAALHPPTGSGRIGGRDPGAVFARRHGYALEQAERYSVLHLPSAAAASLRTAAARAAGQDYRTVWWTDRVPERHLQDMALLLTRMSTDVPSAGLDVEEDPWDAARVRRADEDVAAAGHGYLCVAAEHLRSGRLVAFTTVEYPHDKPAVVFQEDTLVLRDHRGHRLGMLVKATLLERLAEIRPDARRIHTWNAEENEHMLAINVALGFRPAGVSGLWQKRSPAAQCAGAPAGAGA